MMTRRNFCRYALAGIGFLGGADVIWNDAKENDSILYDKKILGDVASKILKRKRNHEQNGGREEPYLGNVNGVGRIYAGNSAILYGGYIKESVPTVGIPPYIEKLFEKKESHISFIYNDKGLKNDSFLRENVGEISDFVEKRIREQTGINISTSHGIYKNVQNAGANNIEMGFESFPRFETIKGEEEAFDGNNIKLSSENYNIILEPQLASFSIGNSQTVGGETRYFSNVGKVDIGGWKETANKDETIRNVKAVSLHESLHGIGLPHCAEDKCVMNTDSTKTSNGILGKRCKNIARNVLNGELVKSAAEEKGIWWPRIYVKPAKALNYKDAEEDLISNLKNYMTRTTQFGLLDNIEMSAELAEGEDTVLFSKNYNNKEMLAKARIGSFFETFDVL